MKKFIPLLFFLIFPLFAESIGMIKDLYGKVRIKRGDKFIEASKGLSLKEGDIIFTDSSSGVGVVFKDGSLLSLDEKSIFKVKSYIFSPEKEKYGIDVKLEKGKAAFSSGKIGKLAPKSFKFRVPEGVVGIRGTKFLVSVNK